MDSTNAGTWEVQCTVVTPPTSPSDVTIVPGAASLHPGAAVPPGTLRAAVAIARVNQPALTGWLRNALDRTLRGLPPAGPRPGGRLLERGSFAQEDREVVARDWYGHGRQAT